MKTVVLLHAGIADRRMWERQAETLESAGYRVVAPDLRGFGDAAVEISLRMWVDGPHRSPDEVDPAVRAAVREMVLRSYVLQRRGGAQEEEVLDVASRLAEIRCPTLVVVGDLDLPEMQAIAAHVAQKVADGRLVTIRRAAHLPSLEHPDELDALVLGFL